LAADGYRGQPGWLLGGNREGAQRHHAGQPSGGSRPGLAGAAGSGAGSDAVKYLAGLWERVRPAFMV